MRLSLLGSAVAALVLAAGAAAALPSGGALVPGRSLGGVRLGEQPKEVFAALGRFYGACRECAHPTWYFTYHPFDRRGLAVEFAGGRVSAVYTLWRPPGWRGPRGLRFGATPLDVHQRARTTRTIACAGYDALVRDSAHARTAYYLVGARLWGFGLFRNGASPCR
jgi:hypothetical protein